MAWFLTGTLLAGQLAWHGPCYTPGQEARGCLGWHGLCLPAHAMPHEAIRANYKNLFSWPFPLPKLRLNVSSGLLSAEPVGLKD